MDTTPHSDQTHQCTTCGPDSCVSQGLKNVHLLIKGYENEHSYLHVHKEMDCKALNYAPIVGDDFLSKYRLYNQAYSHGYWKAGSTNGYS
jgi:hypothetical protein